MVDINTRLANGARHRERKRLSISSKSAAQRWGQDRERHLLQHGPPQPKKEVPTLNGVRAEVPDGHARANRQKPSGIAAKEMILRVHLIPALGHKRLDAISNEDVQRLKTSPCRSKAPKTVNNMLTVLSVLLKQAVEWDVIDRLPCRIKVLRSRRVRRSSTTSTNSSGWCRRGDGGSASSRPRAAGGRSRATVGRDGGVGMGRHRFR